MAFVVRSDRYRAMIDQFRCKMTAILRRDDDCQNSSPDLPGVLLQSVPQMSGRILFKDAAAKSIPGLSMVRLLIPPAAEPCQDIQDCFPLMRIWRRNKEQREDLNVRVPTIEPS